MKTLNRCKRSLFSPKIIGAFFAIFALIAQPLAIVPLPTASAASTLTVCEVMAPGCDYTSIQAAVDAAVNGDTVSVGIGNYTEAVLITESISLVGETKAGTRIHAPASMTGSDAIVKVSGAGVSAEIRRLTVEGPGPSSCGSIYAGVYVTGNANAELRNLNVTSIRDQPFSGCQNGRAIYVGGAGVGSANITNVTVSDYQKGGIYVSNAGSTAVVTSSTVVGAGVTSTIAQNGMAAVNGAQLNVINTNVRQNNYAPAGTIATGVLFFNASPASSVSADSNIKNNEIGVYTTSAAIVPNINLAATVNNVRNVVTSLSGLSAPTATYVVSGLTGTADADGNDVVSAAGSNHIYGYDAFSGIQGGINAVAAGASSTVNVGAGTYNEDVNVSKQVSVLGAGAGVTSIVGTSGNTTPVFFSSNNATLSGFTITHNYTSGELAAWNFNNNGVAFGQLTTGNTLSNSTVSLNRNGVYLNNSQGNKVIGNTITNNRTGVNMTNALNGTQITGNTISGNWTVGLVMYGASSTLVTDLSTLNVSGNTFDQNWYTEMLIKDTPYFTGALNVTNNTFTDTPVTYSTSAATSLNEPGFADQKPVVLGGAAVKPAQELPTLRIYNAGDATFDYVSPNLDVNADEVTLINGTNVVSLPQDATITPSDPSWNGIVNAPTVVSTTVPLPTGATQGVAIEVGSNSVSLTFDKAARLLIGGEAGKMVGYMHNGNFVQIQTICSADTQAAGDALPVAGDCYMNVAGDLVVWTKHFTVFATYTPAKVVTPAITLPLVKATTSTVSSFASIFNVTSATDSSTTQTGDVLGTKTTKKQSAKTPVVEATDSGWKIIGLAWYWWVVVFVALGAAAGYFLMRRRNAQN